MKVTRWPSPSRLRTQSKWPRGFRRLAMRMTSKLSGERSPRYIASALSIRETLLLLELTMTPSTSSLSVRTTTSSVSVTMTSRPWNFIWAPSRMTSLWSSSGHWPSRFGQLRRYAHRLPWWVRRTKKLWWCLRTHTHPRHSLTFQWKILTVRRKSVRS